MPPAFDPHQGRGRTAARIANLAWRAAQADYNPYVTAAAHRNFDSRCEKNFAELAGRCFEWGDLERHPWPVAGLWRDGTIAYVNPAWSVFSHENGAGLKVDREWSLGANYFAAINDELRPFFTELLAHAPTTQQSLAPYTHEYECSSEDQTRRFALQVFALPERRGYMLVHSLLVSAAQETASEHAPPPADHTYKDGEGTVKQCAHCRRIAHGTHHDRWDWIPAWIRHPPAFISHTICKLCYGVFYPGLRRRRR